MEVQALVQLPKFGERPGIKAPYLPRQKLGQLIGTVSRIQDIDISDLTFEVNCAVPGGLPYHQTLDLPLIVSMLSSYLQLPIPLWSLYVGEVDLMQNIRPLESRAINALATLLSPQTQLRLARLIKKLYVSEESCAEVNQVLAKNQCQVTVHGVSNLEAVIKLLWPQAIEETKALN